MILCLRSCAFKVLIPGLSQDALNDHGGRGEIRWFICVGVPIGTPALEEDWTNAKNRELIKDLQKLKLVSDPLIHYHLVRFCGLTRPGYMCRTLPSGLVESPSVHLEDFDLALSAEIFTKGVGEQWRDWPDSPLA